jgi:hypothetical protein
MAHEIPPDLLQSACSLPLKAELTLQVGGGQKVIVAGQKYKYGAEGAWLLEGSEMLFPAYWKVFSQNFESSEDYKICAYEMYIFFTSLQSNWIFCFNFDILK